jgi:hypothetical protein
MSPDVIIAPGPERPPPVVCAWVRRIVTAVAKAGSVARVKNGMVFSV